MHEDNQVLENSRMGLEIHRELLTIGGHHKLPMFFKLKAAIPETLIGLGLNYEEYNDLTSAVCHTIPELLYHLGPTGPIALGLQLTEATSNSLKYGIPSKEELVVMYMNKQIDIRQFDRLMMTSVILDTLSFPGHLAHKGVKLLGDRLYTVVDTIRLVNYMYRSIFQIRNRSSIFQIRNKPAVQTRPISYEYKLHENSNLCYYLEDISSRMSLMPSMIGDEDPKVENVNLLRSHFNLWTRYVDRWNSITSKLFTNNFVDLLNTAVSSYSVFNDIHYQRRNITLQNQINYYNRQRTKLLNWIEHKTLTTTHGFEGLLSELNTEGSRISSTIKNIDGKQRKLIRRQKWNYLLASASSITGVSKFLLGSVTSTLLTLADKNSRIGNLQAKRNLLESELQRIEYNLESTLDYAINNRDEIPPWIRRLALKEKINSIDTQLNDYRLRSSTVRRDLEKNRADLTDQYIRENSIAHISDRGWEVAEYWRNFWFNTSKDFTVSNSLKENTYKYIMATQEERMAAYNICYSLEWLGSAMQSSKLIKTALIARNSYIVYDFIRESYSTLIPNIIDAAYHSLGLNATKSPESIIRALGGIPNICLMYVTPLITAIFGGIVLYNIFTETPSINVENIRFQYIAEKLNELHRSMLHGFDTNREILNLFIQDIKRTVDKIKHDLDCRLTTEFASSNMEHTKTQYLIVDQTSNTRHLELKRLRLTGKYNANLILNEHRIMHENRYDWQKVVSVGFLQQTRSNPEYYTDLYAYVLHRPATFSFSLLKELVIWSMNKDDSIRNILNQSLDDIRYLYDVSNHRSKFQELYVNLTDEIGGQMDLAFKWSSDVECDPQVLNMFHYASSINDLCVFDDDWSGISRPSDRHIFDIGTELFHTKDNLKYDIEIILGIRSLYIRGSCGVIPFIEDYHYYLTYKIAPLIRIITTFYFTKWQSTYRPHYRFEFTPIRTVTRLHNRDITGGLNFTAYVKIVIVCQGRIGRRNISQVWYYPGGLSQKHCLYNNSSNDDHKLMSIIIYEESVKFNTSYHGYNTSNHGYRYHIIKYVEEPLLKTVLDHPVRSPSRLNLDDYLKMSKCMFAVHRENKYIPLYFTHPELSMILREIKIQACYGWKIRPVYDFAYSLVTDCYHLDLEWMAIRDGEYKVLVKVELAQVDRYTVQSYSPILVKNNRIYNGNPNIDEFLLNFILGGDDVLAGPCSVITQNMVIPVGVKFPGLIKLWSTKERHVNFDYRKYDSNYEGSCLDGPLRLQWFQLTNTQINIDMSIFRRYNEYAIISETLHILSGNNCRSETIHEIFQDMALKISSMRPIDNMIGGIRSEIDHLSNMLHG